MARSAPLTVLALVAFAGASRADTVELKPTGKVDGEIARETSVSIFVRLPSGRIVELPKRHVKSVVRTGGLRATGVPTPAPAGGTAKGAGAPAVSADAELVPPEARLGIAPPEDPPAPVEFARELEELLRSDPSPEVLAAWVKAMPRTEAELAHVARLARTAADGGVRLALWHSLAEAEPERAEARLLAFATSDVRTVRVDACRALALYASWERSLPVLSRLLALPHAPSCNAAADVLAGLAASQPAPDDVVRALGAGLARARSSAAWEAHLSVLAACAARGSPLARACLEREVASATLANRRAEALRELLWALSREEARGIVARVLGERTSASLWEHALLALRDVGTFAEIPLVVPFLTEESGVPADARCLGAKLPGPEALLGVANALARRRTPFASAAEYVQWWEGVRPAFDDLESLLAALSRGGKAGVAAARSLAEIQLPSVDAALRRAATGADAELRVEACGAIAARLDRKGARAVLAAFRLAARNPAERERVGTALLNLAAGRPVPLVDPEDTERWWRAAFPGDLAEE